MEVAICPYCGLPEEESYALGRFELRDSGEIDCARCERAYRWYRIVEIRYETKPVGSPPTNTEE